MYPQSRQDAARKVIEWHFTVAPDIDEIYLVPGNDEPEDDEPIKLVEVTQDAHETGSIDVFYFSGHGDIPYPTAVAEVTPRELQRIREGELSLPSGWDLDNAERFPRLIFRDTCDNGGK